MIGRHRLFALTNIGLLAVSIGFACSAYGLIDAVLWRPLPVPHPEQLVLVTGLSDTRHPLRVPLFELVAKTRAGVTSVFGTQSYGGLLSTIGSTSLPLRALAVAGDYFGGMGRVPLVMGRVFDPDRPDPVCVISDRLWREQFGADRGVIGRTITLASTSLSVVGVASPDFVGTYPTLRWDFVASFRVVNQAMGRPIDTQSVETGMRLEPGMSLAALQTQLNTIWPVMLESTIPSGLNASQWRQLQGSQVDVQSLRNGVAYDVLNSPRLAPALKLAFGLSLLILLAGGVAIALLAVARGVQQQRQTALMLALGGTRWRVVRPLLLEYGLMAALGCAGSLLIAAWGSELGRSFLDSTRRVGVNLAVVRLAIVMTAGVAVMGALTCISAAARAATHDVLRSSRSVTRAYMRARGGLLILQVALAVVLAYSSVMFSRNLAALARIDVGFDVSHLHVFQLVGRPPSRAVDDGYFNELTAALRRVPGVESVGMTATAPPLSFPRETVQPITVDDGRERQASIVYVFPGIFDVWNVPVVQGRQVSLADRHSVVISEKLARQLFADQSPLFHHLRTRTSESLQIIGVVRNLSYFGPRLGPSATIFASYHDLRTPWPSTNAWQVHVRSARTLADLGRDVGHEVERLGTHFVYDVTDEETLAASSLQQERMLAIVSSAFGSLLLALIGVGLYAFCVYALALRHQELAIRASLGASPRAIVLQLLRETLVIVGVGSVVGLVLAFGAQHALAGFLGDLHGVRFGDVLILIVVIGLVVSSALIGPTRRAARLDLARALKGD